MDTIECIYQRRSIRKFKEDPIDEGLIDQLLKAAMAAPSACNKQPWAFYVVQNKDKKEALRKVSKYSNHQAPLVIVVCGNIKRSLSTKANDFWIQDCSAAIENILLASTALGLGSLWCGVYPVRSSIKRTKAILDLPKEMVPLGLIYLGYPHEVKSPRTQYDDSFVYWIR